jgi:predicted Ser/Thr protein kinase
MQAGLAGSAPATTGYQAGFVAPTPQELAAHFPQLEIAELLGQGGMGAVYRARQRGLDRPVALKILPPQAAGDPAFAERFTREARSLARLSHPHIVTVYESGKTGDFYYFIMEFVDGVDLRRLLRDRKLKPEEALKLVPQICEALQYAHEEGVVHRDIKPENILLDRKGRIKIADFGLAKLLVPEPSQFTLTSVNQVMGTLRYMAPEQMERPQEVDHRADIFSLGVVFYEMLTGELPVGRFELPSRKVQVDVRLDEVVLRALENRPERRYQHASDIKSDLESIAASGGRAPAGAQGQLSPLGTPLPAGSGPMLLAAAIGIVISALCMAGGVALLAYAALTVPLGSDEFWGWMGGVFGCIIGGGGGLMGSWNSYRQLEGAPDLMQSPDWTWFDSVVTGYAIFGCLAEAAGLLLAPRLNAASIYSLCLIGGLAMLQGGGFAGFRALYRRAAAQGRAAGLKV